MTKKEKIAVAIVAPTFSVLLALVMAAADHSAAPFRCAWNAGIAKAESALDALNQASDAPDMFRNYDSLCSDEVVELTVTTDADLFPASGQDRRMLIQAVEGAFESPYQKLDISERPVIGLKFVDLSGAEIASDTFYPERGDP